MLPSHQCLAELQTGLWQDKINYTHYASIQKLMQLICWFHLTGGKLMIFAIWKHQIEKTQNRTLSNAPSSPFVKLKAQSYPRGCREIWETHVLPLQFNHGASKRLILQQADGCVEHETASPKPLAQASAHGNTCRETDSVGYRSLSLIFNKQLRLYSPTAKSFCAPERLVQLPTHHRCYSPKGQACFIKPNIAFPSPAPLLPPFSWQLSILLHKHKLL